MKGKKRQIQEILESFSFIKQPRQGRLQMDQRVLENFYVPTCIATIMLPLRRTLVLQQFY
jgi:hypothetical protein